MKKFYFAVLALVFLSPFASAQGKDTTSVFDNFENLSADSTTMWATKWSPLLGAGAEGAFEYVSGGANQTEFSFHIQVQYPAGGYGCIQANLSPDDGPMDISQKFSGIKFYAKNIGNDTNIVKFRVRELKAENDRGWEFAAFNFKPTADWKLYDVTLDSVSLVGEYSGTVLTAPPFSATDIKYIDFAPAKSAQKIDIMVDEIVFYKKVTTGVRELNAAMPSNYALSQNYPNPFNPSTTINFSLPKSGSVTLKVYNMLGKEVGTLLNKFMEAGTYKTDFNASSMPSGIYFYKLDVNGISLAKKLTLLK
jgi:hypothetical protein